MIAAISGSVMPASVCSATFACTPYSSAKARCQATPPAPPVTKIVPSMSKSTARVPVLPLMPSLLQQFSLAQPVQEAERRQDDYDGGTEDDEHRIEGRARRRRLADLQGGRQQVGELGCAPAPDHGDDGADRERTQPGAGPAQETDEDDQPA